MIVRMLGFLLVVPIASGEWPQESRRTLKPPAAHDVIGFANNPEYLYSTGVFKFPVAKAEVLRFLRRGKVYPRDYRSDWLEMLALENLPLAEALLEPQIPQRIEKP